MQLLHGISSEDLNKRPGNKWCVAEILSHLITAEKMSLRYIQKKILGIEQIADTGVWEEVKINLLKISQRLPGLKFKAPQSVIDNTPVYRDLTTLHHEWSNLREELHSLLEKIPDHYRKRKIYRHVYAGYLNIGHALVFLREHISHHTPQILKLVNNKSLINIEI